MYTFNDWHLVRELTILLVLGLFIVVAVVTGWWQSRRKAPGRTPAQDQRLHSLYIACH